jgi:hypothetical protein
MGEMDTRKWAWEELGGAVCPHLAVQRISSRKRMQWATGDERGVTRVETTGTDVWKKGVTGHASGGVGHGARRWLRTGYRVMKEEKRSGKPENRKRLRPNSDIGREIVAGSRGNDRLCPTEAG